MQLYLDIDNCEQVFKNACQNNWLLTSVRRLLVIVCSEAVMEIAYSQHVQYQQETRDAKNNLVKHGDLRRENSYSNLDKAQHASR